MASCRVSIRWEKCELATCKGNGSPVSAEESNKALIREFFEEAWLKGNVAAVDEFMAADYVEHPRPSTLPPGPEGLKAADRLISHGLPRPEDDPRRYLRRR